MSTAQDGAFLPQDLFCHYQCHRFVSPKAGIGTATVSQRKADIPEPRLLQLSSFSFSFFSFVACYLTRAAKINETAVRAYPTTTGRKAPWGRTVFPTGTSMSEGSPNETNIHPSKSARKWKLKKSEDKSKHQRFKNTRVKSHLTFILTPKITHSGKKI